MTGRSAPPQVASVGVRLILGQGVLGVGIALMLHADVGLATYEVVTTALMQMGAPTGFAVAGSLLLAACLGLGLRVRPGLVAGLGLVLPPLVVAAITPLLPDAWSGRLLTMLVGSLVVGTGVAVYLSAGRGAGPGDLAYLGLLRRGYGPGWSKVAHDAVVTGLGWLAGGSVGPGTLIAVAVVGPTVAAVRRVEGARGAFELDRPGR